MVEINLFKSSPDAYEAVDRLRHANAARNGSWIRARRCPTEGRWGT